MLAIKNTHLGDNAEAKDIYIDNGVFVAIVDAGSEGPAAEEIIDAAGAMAWPPFVEPHVHLDTTLTAGEPRWNLSGTLFEGIECWSDRKKELTIDDVKTRARTLLQWQIANGIGFVRSHIDTSDPSLVALKAMLELKEEMAEWITVQIVAFPQEGINSFPNGAELLEQALQMGADVVGGIPHFEFTREYGIDSLHTVFKLAKKYHKLIDIHCDEIDDEQSRFVETVAALAVEYDMGPQTTASHTTAMHSYNDAYASRLFRLLRISGINFVANPLVNIHLQGRFDSYPKRRGITRVKELDKAGINVCFGHDDICDPWYPMGTGNIMQALHMGMHVCQMMGYEQLNNCLRFISHNSARTLNIEDQYGIEVGKPGNLLLLDADNNYDALRRQAAILYSIRAGKVIAQTQPAVTTIATDRRQQIDFKR